MNMGQLYKNHKEAVLYIVCGGFTTLISWASYALFVSAGLELNISNILSWVCGVLFAFVVNKWIVFECKSVEKITILKELGGFIGSRIATGILAFVLFPVLLYIGLDQSIMGFDGMVARIITSIIEIALNWVLSKYFVFTHKN